MKKEIVKFLILLSVALGAAPAYSAFWQWSKTASVNAGADPTINWAEGMSPSSVNDSARAMMARAAEYRDDISGLLVTGGLSTAFTLTTNQGLNSTPTTGQMLAFRPFTTSGAGVTLTVDGGTAFPIQSELGVGVASGSLVGGSPYRVSFNGTAWVLEGFYSNPYQIPLGGILLSTAPTPPNSAFVAPSGQCISTTTYAAYWVQQGSPASGICPGGQFQIIDMRGYAVAALDTLNASAANRLTSSATGCGTAMTSVGAVCASGAQSQSLLAVNIPSLTSTNPAQGISVRSTSTKIVTNASGTFDSASVPGGAQSLFPAGSTVQAAQQTSSDNNSITVTSTGTTGTAFPRVQPTIGLIPYLRIL